MDINERAKGAFHAGCRLGQSYGHSPSVLGCAPVHIMHLAVWAFEGVSL